MKWLFALLLAIIIFGGAAWFGYNFFLKQEIAVQREQRGEVNAEPTPDISLPEFEAAARLRQEGKLPEARSALAVFIQKYPGGLHAEEAAGNGDEVAEYDGLERGGNDVRPGQAAQHVVLVLRE